MVALKIANKPFTKEEIGDINNKFGDYIKVTADIDNENIVVGCELHADGERILIEKGSTQDNIWGGGINLKDKIIDTTAVLNLRPRLGNDSMEILDPERREKYVGIMEKYFDKLWH